MTDPAPRLTLGDLADRALAASTPAERVSLVAQLARGTRTAEQIAAVAEWCLAPGPPAGRRVFLEWVARVRGPIPESVLALIKPLLSDRKIPPSVRVSAAARVLRSVPDRLEAVRPVTRALTARLSPARGLERLRQLQHQIETCDTLDTLIERREQRVKMDCPRCGLRLPRVAMVKHLWHEHALFLEQGKVRSPRRVLEAVEAALAASRDTTLLDRASVLANPQAMRAWVAASDPPADDTAALREMAAEHDAGLCPACLTELPRAVAPFPLPLVLADGRLAGDGYTVEVGGAEWLRTLAISGPRHVIRSGADRRRGVGPRGAAALAALPLVLAAVLAAALIPVRLIRPFPVVGCVVLFAFVTYGLVWLLRKPLPPPDARAIDAAWSVLARRFLGRDGSPRFLTRLCRTSYGIGNPVERVGVVNLTLERAASEAKESDEWMQLLAAARVLQIEDAARLGRDRVAGIAALAAATFRGELSTDYAEAVAECVLNRTPAPEAGDRARLRVLLLAAAFDAGLKPRDLIDLWTVAPNLRAAMALEPLHRLALFAGVWHLRNSRRWERIAPADTVFELCRVSPNLSGRVLPDYPDLLLYHRPDPAIESQLGPVLVCGRGVMVGGVMVADPDADVRVVKLGRFGGGYDLAFGPHRLRLTRKPPDDFAETLRGWLHFRATVLLPYIDGYLEPGSREVYERLLAPFCRRCRSCGTVSAVSVGTIGTQIRPGR